MKWYHWLLIVTNALTFICLLLLLDAQGASMIVKGDWEYKDLVAVLLSVVSIIVTFIGIIVALAAIWGYQTIKSMAEEKAVQTSSVAINAHLGSDAFSTKVDEAIRARMDAVAKDVVQDTLNPLILRSDAAPEFQVKDEEWRD